MLPSILSQLNAGDGSYSFHLQQQQQQHHQQPQQPYEEEGGAGRIEVSSKVCSMSPLCLTVWWWSEAASVLQDQEWTQVTVRGARCGDVWQERNINIQKCNKT